MSPEVILTRSRTALQELGVKVEYHAYPMAHSVCNDEIRDLGNWLTVRFAGG